MSDDTLAGWLLLREPADAAARSAAVTATLVDAVGGRDSIRVLDLGSGTGANVRYLVPHLPRRQQWLLTDRDPQLLTMAPVRLSSWAAAQGLGLHLHPQGSTVHGAQLICDIDTRVVDLDRLDDASLFDGRDVVTASALLDLTSEQWLRTLAGRCRAAGAAVIFALSYNGLSTCTPAEPEDDLVRDLLNRHQRTDKGLGGEAAGPEASELAVRCFTDAGYQVHAERSDWLLDSTQHELQRRLVAGWAEAAIELMPDTAGTIAGWRRRRDRHIDTNSSRIVVGHVDMAGWLPG